MNGRVTAHQLFENVREAAEDELERSSLGLAFSGLSAGLNIAFSFVAVAAVLGSVAPEHAHLWAAVAYPTGFIVVILARAQLFTENTLTPVILVLTNPTAHNLKNTARLWAIVLAANLTGASVFAFVLATLDVAPGLEPAVLLTAAEEAFAGGWGNLFLRAIFGGWLIALMVWILHSGTGITGQFLVVWLLAFVIQAAGFSHSVAGAVEVLYLAHRGSITYFGWFWDFQVPVTLGNIVGGVVFVALVNYAQAVGAGRDVERAELRQRVRESRRNGEAQAAEQTAAPPTQRNPRRD